jgi:hypothetical protein
MTEAPRIAVEEIEARLLSRIEALARELAPQGKRMGHEWVALNPARADARAGSFSINLQSGRWADFAAGVGAKTLPALGLVAYLATGGDFTRAIFWAKDWLGLSGQAPSPAQAAKVRADLEAQQKKREEADAKRVEKNRRFAQAIWLNAYPLDGRDPASLYLAARGIDVMRLPEGPPRALRWHPKVEARPENVAVPAMLAALSKEGVGFAAVHRTYLAERGGVWGKAFGRNSKRILGPKSGASVRLVKGASGKVLSLAPAGEWIGLGEGIENVLSASVVKPGLRMLAATTLENIAKIQLPEQIGGVRIIADNDKPGSPAEEQLEKVVNHLAFDRGIDLEIVRAPAGFKDFNDALCGRRAA